MATLTCKSIPWLKVLRVFGVLGACAIIAISIYDLATENPEIKAVVNNIYRIIFGILIIIAEIQIVKILDWFSFLLTLVGLGGFYIFVGGLALGSEWYAITIAVILVFIGLAYCISGLACKDDRETAVALKQGGTAANPATSSGPGAGSAL